MTVNALPIVEIWSGGQTGVDQAALEFAASQGIPTGGWMPRGFLTEEGPRPEFAKSYGVKEMGTADYAARTKRNARETDGTVWIAGPGDLSDDRGYVTTSKAAVGNRKAFLVVPAGNDARNVAAEIYAWAVEHQIRRLNVAGPRASRWPDSGARVQTIFGALFGIDS